MQLIMLRNFDSYNSSLLPPDKGPKFVFPSDYIDCLSFHIEHVKKMALREQYKTKGQVLRLCWEFLILSLSARTRQRPPSLGPHEQNRGKK